VCDLLLDGVAVLIVVGGVDDLISEALRDGLQVAEGVVAGLRDGKRKHTFGLYSHSFST
jgi:hypothetical protein